MKKNTYLLLRKWHFLGGLFALPFVILLAATGLIYLCKDYYEEEDTERIVNVSPATGGEALTLEAQLGVARGAWERPINSVELPSGPDKATGFVAGRFGGKATVYVDPYSSQVTGQYVAAEADMYKVRKLHGELLLGGFGTKIVELVGSWLVVLIVSGIVLFLPRLRNSWRLLFRPRPGTSRTVYWRDVHGLLGFWCSVVLLLILAGGLPWTDVWGAGFKWVQQQTNTGFPPAWSGRGLSSDQATAGGETLSLDEAAAYARSLDLPGTVTVTLPRGPQGVYGIHNEHFPEQSRQRAVHLDQYSGAVVSDLGWSDVGVLMRGRMWAMAFHQGQLGTWNWLLVFLVTALLLALSAAAAVAWYSSQGERAPTRIVYPAGLIACLVVLGVLLPLFGVSVLLILAYEAVGTRRQLARA